MQLQEFVTTSIVQIVKGIENAVDQLKDSTAIVSPGTVVAAHKDWQASCSYYAPNAKHSTRVIHSVEFDVAVYASEGKETKGGIGIMVGTIGLGSQGKSDVSSSSQSRLKFTVPIVLPAGDAGKAVEPDDNEHARREADPENWTA
jgi:hypothetical protein